MKSVLGLLLSLCGQQASGVHLHTSGATANSPNRTAPLPVVVVMFDHTYMKLFDCFLRYWAHQVVDPAHANKLDVVVYDQAAMVHAGDVIRTYPAGIVRKVQLRDVSPPAHRQLRLAARRSRSAWSSMVYQSYFWEAIQERLDLGEDVLHMDLDAIVVGDAWAPLAGSNPGADMVAPPPQHSFGLGQQYILYRNTPATKEVVKHFSSVWKDWLSGTNGTLGRKPPMNEEGAALGAYISEYNPGGCRGEGLLRVCKTHTGGTVSWDAPASLGGLEQNGQCTPEECRARGTHVCHGRRQLGAFCSHEETVGPRHQYGASP